MIDTTAKTIAGNGGSAVFPSMGGGSSTPAAAPNTTKITNAPAGFDIAPGANLSGTYNASNGALTKTSDSITASTPVITSKGAQDDYNQKYATFQSLLDSIKNQTTALSQAQAFQAEQKASSDLQNAQLKLQQQGVDLKKAEIDAKNYALGIANTPNNSTPQANITDKSGNSSATQNLPPGWDATSYSNFKAANPNIEPDAQDTRRMQEAGTVQGDLNNAAEDKLTGLGQVTDARDQLTQQTNQLLGSLMAGTIPLSAPQQALITSLQNQLVQHENEQRMANQAFEGTVQESAFRSGGEYTPEQMAGQIHNAVSIGVSKIQALDNAAAKTIADLEISYQKDNFDIINKQFDNLNKSLDAKAAAIKDTYETVTKTLQDQRDFQQKITESVNKIAEDAAKNGATKEQVAKINAARTESEAINAAGDLLQTGTGVLGEYLQYKRDTTNKGLVPMDFGAYKDAQDAKAMKLKVSEAYSIKLAQNQADAKYTSSDKAQQKLEQQYRQVLSKEFSSRTGALGIENAKVNQANHLNSLFSQYYDPKTGNYNVPKSQYAELAIGLANLVSPNGTVTEGARDAIMQKTAKGDFNGAISYITGTPQNGSSQEIIKNLIDSVDRQAQTASRNRESALQNMRDQAPTDLEQSRIDKLNKSTEMVKYEGQDRISKTAVNSYVQTHPTEADAIAKLYEVPGATDEDVEAYLKAQGKLK